MALNDSVDKQARKLSILNILLLFLHILFGVTGVIGVLVAHVSLDLVKGTVYHSHLKWQIVTFWIALAAYAVAGWLFLNHGMVWPALLVLVFVLYRLIVNLRAWLTRSAIGPYTEHEI